MMSVFDSQSEPYVILKNDNPNDTTRYRVYIGRAMEKLFDIENKYKKKVVEKKTARKMIVKKIKGKEVARYKSLRAVRQ